jgi:hypothetical protein
VGTRANELLFDSSYDPIEPAIIDMIRISLSGNGITHMNDIFPSI